VTPGQQNVNTPWVVDATSAECFELDAASLQSSHA